MTKEELIQVLSYAKDNHITEEESKKHFGFNFNMGLAYYKKKYNVLEFNKQKITKDVLINILKYSNENGVSEKNAAKHFGYNVSLCSYKRKYGIPVNPIGNAKFTARIKRKYSVNDNFFDVPNILNCYYAGFLAADGCIDSKRKSLLTLSVARKDRCHLEKFKNEIEFNGNIRDYILVRDNKKFYNSTIAITSEKICNDLKKNFNITPQKSKTLSPPNIEDEKCIYSFICGYIDGDGTILLTKNKNGYDTLSLNILGTKKMCEWIFEKLKTITNNKGNIKSKSNIFRLSFSTKSARNIFQVLYNLDVPKLERKWSKDKYDFCINFKKHNPISRRKGVNVFDLYGNLIKHFDCLKEAQKFTGVNYSNISRLCKLDSNKYQSNGYMFSRNNHMEKYIPNNYFFYNLEKKLVQERKINADDFKPLTDNK